MELHHQAKKNVEIILGRLLRGPSATTRVMSSPSAVVEEWADRDSRIRSLTWAGDWSLLPRMRLPNRGLTEHLFLLVFRFRHTIGKQNEQISFPPLPLLNLEMESLEARKSKQSVRRSEPFQLTGFTGTMERIRMACVGVGHFFVALIDDDVAATHQEPALDGMKGTVRFMASITAPGGVINRYLRVQTALGHGHQKTGIEAMSHDIGHDDTDFVLA